MDREKLDNLHDLTGRVAIITGGTRGIGKAIALACADEGANIVVADYGVAMDGSDPSSEGYHNGLGCNAGGVTWNCRFCGFGTFEACPYAPLADRRLDQTTGLAPAGAASFCNEPSTGQEQCLCPPGFEGDALEPSIAGNEQASGCSDVDECLDV